MYILSCFSITSPISQASLPESFYGPFPPFAQWRYAFRGPGIEDHWPAYDLFQSAYHYGSYGLFGITDSLEPLL